MLAEAAPKRLAAGAELAAGAPNAPALVAAGPKEKAPAAACKEQQPWVADAPSTGGAAQGRTWVRDSQRHRILRCLRQDGGALAAHLLVVPPRRAQP